MSIPRPSIGAIRRIRDHYDQRWRAERLIVGSRFNYDIDCNEWRLVIDLPDNYHLAYTFSRHELRMGGMQDVARWFEHVSRDIWRYAERQSAGPQMTAAEVMDRRDEFFASATNRLDQVFVDQFANEFLRFTLGQESTQDKVANKKAADLFRSVAGEAAYKRLESGEGLPITGSKGTFYTLYKKASYCIERDKDGAKLCAVVPGVPLWDHLLGIKLMVENDEPLFLKTANVSGGAFTAVDWPEMTATEIRTRMNQMYGSIRFDPRNWNL